MMPGIPLPMGVNEPKVLSALSWPRQAGPAARGHHHPAPT